MNKLLLVSLISACTLLYGQSQLSAAMSQKSVLEPGWTGTYKGHTISEDNLGSFVKTAKDEDGVTVYLFEKAVGETTCIYAVYRGAVGQEIPKPNCY